MIRVLSSNVLAWERKAQLADEGLWFSCLLSGTKKKKCVEVGCKQTAWGKEEKQNGKKRSIKMYSDIFLSNEDAQASFL